MPRKSRFLAIALAAAILWGCGRITDLTYEKAAEFEGTDFPPENNSSDLFQIFGNGTSLLPEPSSQTSDISAGSAVTADTFSDGGYYYENLDPKLQESYRILFDGLSAGADEIGGLSEDSTEVFPAVGAIYLDHPEMPWLSNGGGRLTYGTGEGVYTPEYLALSEGHAAAEQAGAAADAFLAGVDVSCSDYEKVRAVFEHLVDTVDYSDADGNCRDIYGALVERKAVCAGYSAAAKYLLDRLGVPCMTVTGNTLAEGQPHAWNIVWIDGEPYHMDVTWGDPSFGEDDSVPEGYRNYAYLLMSTADILSERYIDEGICTVPVCTSESDYYLREGLYLTSYSDSVGQLMVNAYREGESWMTVSFAEEVSLDDVLYQLFDCGDFYGCFRDAGISLGPSSYTVNETANTLTVFFR